MTQQQARTIVDLVANGSYSDHEGRISHATIEDNLNTWPVDPCVYLHHGANPMDVKIGSMESWTRYYNECIMTAPQGA
jgi:hypothetical protein